MTLRYSRKALADLRRLHAFIEVKDPSAARRLGHELVGRIEALMEFPDIGRPVRMAPEPSSIRDLIADRYIVRYSVHENTIVVLRIWHHLEARD